MNFLHAKEAEQLDWFLTTIAGLRCAFVSHCDLADFSGNTGLLKSKLLKKFIALFYRSLLFVRPRVNLECHSDKCKYHVSQFRTASNCFKF